jgi:hypothetical protein
VISVAAAENAPDRSVDPPAQTVVQRHRGGLVTVPKSSDEVAILRSRALGRRTPFSVVVPNES